MPFPCALYIPSLDSIRQFPYIPVYVSPRLQITPNPLLVYRTALVEDDAVVQQSCRFVQELPPCPLKSVFEDHQECRVRVDSRPALQVAWVLDGTELDKVVSHVLKFLLAICW